MKHLLTAQLMQMKAVFQVGLALAMGAAVWAAEEDGQRAAGVNAQTNRSVADAGQIVLIVPAPAVHIPNGSGLFDKTLTQTDAAQRLQMLIHRATGILPDIVSATHAPASATRVFVGYGQHLKGKVTPPTRPKYWPAAESTSSESCGRERSPFTPAASLTWFTASSKMDGPSY